MMGVTIRGSSDEKVRSLLTALAVVLSIAADRRHVRPDRHLQKGLQQHLQRVGLPAAMPSSAANSFSTSPRAAARRFQPASWTRSGRCRTRRGGRRPGSPTSVQLEPRAARRRGRHEDRRRARPPSASGSTPASCSSPLSLTAGAWARGADQVVIDANTASRRATRLETRSAWPRPRAGRAVRDHGHCEGSGPSTRSVVRRSPSSTYHRPRRASSARRASSTRSRLRRRKARRRSSSCRRWRRSCGTAEVKTGAAQASADAKTTNDDIAFITYFLLGFGGVALFVGAFSDLQHAVDHRRAAHAEFATVRTLGGSRRQVLGSVVIEGFVIGLLASVVGLFLDGVGKGLNALFVALGIDLPQAGTVFATRTVVVSLLVGTTVTVLASIVPALRATRVPAISAVREARSCPRPASRRTHPTSLSRRSRSQSCRSDSVSS